MQCTRATGWLPWIPQDARDIAQTPYAYRQVEIAREEWDVPQWVDPRRLDPMMNVVDLWWRPPPQPSASPDATRTPGNRAYDTWVQLTDRGPTDVRRPWPLLEPETHALWEAIARAAQEDDTP